MISSQRGEIHSKEVVGQGIYFAPDMKFGHYLKVPPRTLFFAQGFATAWEHSHSVVLRCGCLGTSKTSARKLPSSFKTYTSVRRKWFSLRQNMLLAVHSMKPREKHREVFLKTTTASVCPCQTSCYPGYVLKKEL